MLSKARILILIALVFSASVGAHAGLKRDPVPAEQQQPRFALLIGNTYGIATGTFGGLLKNPGNDARLIGRSLEQVDFDVTVRLDVGQADFERVLRDFAARLSGASNPIVVFYFAGQGLEFGGRNYLVANDLKAEKKEDVEKDALSLNQVMAILEDANRTSLNFILLDACRDDPFQQPTGLRGLAPRGLAAVDPGDRTVVLYSTTAGGIAFDGSGSNSPFAEAVAKYIPTPGLEWADFYRRVQYDVIEASQGRQKPQVFGLPPNQFYFVASAPPAAAETESELRAQASRVAAKDAKQGKLSYTYDDSYALLIGVSRYQDDRAWSDLPGVDRDLASLEKVLKEIHGFTVFKSRNPTAAQLQDTIRNFIKVHGRKENARLLIYYAGHGFTTENRGHKIGWIVPADAPHPVDAPEEFAMTAFSMRRIEEFSEIMQSKHVLWVFDSCFSGALFHMTTREGPGGNAFEEDLLSKPVRRVITSGSEGEKVPDTSVFAELFVDALGGKKKVGRDGSFFTGNELGRFLKEEVLKYRRKQQTPQSGTVVLKGFDEGDILFRLDSKLTQQSSVQRQ